MGEAFSKPIHAIVTIQTGIAIGERMGYRKRHVHLTVAALAGVRSEGRDIPVMTIIAGERSFRRCELMRLE